MQFTPQQLAGGARFSSTTRVGNWLEDVQLEETKIAEFRRRKETGQLALGFRQAKANTCNQPVPHSHARDGLIRFGDTIMLTHDLTSGALACDLWEESVSNPGTFMATVNPEQRASPVARNTFTVVPVTAPRLCESKMAEPDDDYLHFGQGFHLQCNDALLVDDRVAMLKPPMFLSSCLRSQQRGSRISNQQPVYMTQALDSGAVWQAEFHSSSETGSARLLATGEPIPANTPLVLRHRSTGQALSCDPKDAESTDFGVEYEVCCFNSHGCGRRMCLVEESKGTKVAATNVLTEKTQNLWSFTTSDDPSAATETRRLPEPLSVGAVLRRLRSMRVDTVLGAVGYAGQAQKVLRGDVERALLELCRFEAAEDAQLTPVHLGVLLDALDSRQDGMIDLEDLACMLSE